MSQLFKYKKQHRLSISWKQPKNTPVPSFQGQGRRSYVTYLNVWTSTATQDQDHLGLADETVACQYATMHNRCYKENLFKNAIKVRKQKKPSKQANINKEYFWSNTILRQ